MKRQPMRSLKNHQKRIKELIKIDEYLKKNGPVTFSDLILQVDIYRHWLDKFRSRGYLDTELIPSGKQNGKARLIRAVIWKNVKLEAKPNERERILDKIGELTKDNPLSLKALARKIPKSVSTFRYWKNIGLLKYEKRNGKIYITGRG